MSRRKEIIEIRAKINKIESLKIQNINETKSWFFEKITRVNKLLTRLIQEKKKRTPPKLKLRMKEK